MRAVDESLRRLGFSRVSGRGRNTLDKRDAWSVSHVNCVIIGGFESRVNSGFPSLLCKTKVRKKLHTWGSLMEASPFPAGSAWLQFEPSWPH